MPNARVLKRFFNYSLDTRSKTICGTRTRSILELLVLVPSLFQGVYDGEEPDILSELCVRCDKSFGCLDDLREHFFNDHFRIFLRCEPCDKIFLKESDLKNHHDTQHLENSENSAKRSAQMSQNRAKQPRLLKRFSCDLCDESCSTKHYLDLHQEFSHKVCHKCHKMFKNQAELRNHVQTMHSIVQFKCEHCDKTYFSRGAFVLHMKDVHQKTPAEHNSELVWNIWDD